MVRRVTAMIAAIIMVMLTVALCSCTSQSEGGETELIAVHGFDDGSIDQAVASAIKKAYFQKLTDESKLPDSDSPKSANDLFVSFYFGRIGGCEVLRIGGDGFCYTDALRPVCIADCKFAFQSGQPVWVFKDGCFYTVEEAYDANVIEKADVCKIAEKVDPEFKKAEIK